MAVLIYENSGREITQNFETMNSNMALAAGTLAAVLTVLGAGELFGSPSSASQSAPEWPITLSGVSLVVLAVAFPLLYRFFFRSLIAYQNLHRFINLQREAWDYLSRMTSWSYFTCFVETYSSRWRSPESMRKLWWENLKYGYMWVLCVGVVALGWGFVSAPGVGPRVVAGSILAAAALWEGFTTRSHRNRYFRVPSADEIETLEKAKCEAPDPVASVVRPRRWLRG